MNAVSAEQIVTTASAAGVRLIRFLYCDNGGVIRGKLAHIDSLTQRLETGIAGDFLVGSPLGTVGIGPCP